MARIPTDTGDRCDIAAEGAVDAANSNLDLGGDKARLSAFAAMSYRGASLYLGGRPRFSRLARDQNLSLQS